MAKRTAKTKAAVYIATIRVLGQNHTAEGASVAEAIGNLVVPNAKGVGVLTLQNGEQRKERILPRVVVARLFALSPTMRLFALKNVSTLFDL